MTWQVGAFTILALALAGGFAWYERTRPDARIIAVVGTLAAFAALGRVAFAALPNVKPTTDIVLVSGYALGSGPGFAVGALAGLTSNFFFGQGPWTPWQMAGWGVVGVIGAGLAVVTRGRIRRWPLAIVCAVVGFAFTALQDVGDWVTYSDHSLGELGVYVGKGIGFDGVHAAGCLVFALALGPAMIHSLRRFTTRLHVTWIPPTPPALPTLVLVVVVGSWLAGCPGLNGVGDVSAAGTPTGYLLSAQNPDGGFGDSPGAGSSQLYAGWAALGLAASGENPQDVARGGHSVIDYIRQGLGSAGDPGSIERTILVDHAAGLSPYRFGARNLVAALERDLRPNGSVSGQVNLTAFAVLALRAAGATPHTASIAWLVRQQDADGGFNFAVRGGLSDPDDTGAALEALAAGSGAPVAHARARAVTYLRRTQDADGGFASQPGAGSNAQSTAFAVQGLIAAGVDPGSVHRRGASAVDYLRSLIAPDGHVRYSRGTDQTPVWVTAEALMALDGKALPLAPVARRAASRPAVTRLHISTVEHTARHRAAGAPVRRHRPRSPRPVRSTAPVPSAVSANTLDRLVSDAGILTAVVLAPVGAG